ncbi:hypothetical protein U472_12485 [Orenia metallireducens]|uniref:Bypass of forespore C C-terminal domain-containing protein n=1 Tax=Orenia metallireducens TaxID=1413210 RepID=A0A1C0A4X4_9FIRM|nr:BofC C-terminal domain-containing protein [Orenia metallireducens]OCL25181.1 hypothetical protein U472_12485 [Orenia metallireducens]
MKHLNKLMIIPIIIGMIAGLTYLLLDTTINNKKPDKNREELVEEDFYQQQEDNLGDEKQEDVAKVSEVEEEIGRNLTILELVKKEEKRINQKLQTATNIKLSEGLKYLLERLNHPSKNTKQDNRLLESILEVAKEKMEDKKNKTKSDEIIIEINEEDLVKNQQKRADKEEQAKGEGSTADADDFFSWLNEDSGNQSILDDINDNNSEKSEGKETIDNNQALDEEDKEQGLKEQGDDSLESESKEDDSEDKEQVKINNKVFLGVKDGYVAIYKGDSLEAKELLELRKDIPVKKLSEKDKKELLKGIEVASQEELLTVLEGLVSIINE